MSCAACRNAKGYSTPCPYCRAPGDLQREEKRLREREVVALERLAQNAVKRHEQTVVQRLSQVALEAIRVIHCTTHGGDPRVFEPCETCQLGSVGNLREALTRALGPGYTELVWGSDMNIDRTKWDRALSESGE